MNTKMMKSPSIDGFESYEDAVEGDDEQSSRRVIQGSLVKFTNEATWITGDDEELDANLELVAIDIVRVVQRWQDRVPIETIFVEPGQKMPDVEKWNDALPKSEWVEGPDGKARGPWQAQHIVYLLRPETMDRYTFATGTVGGAICVRDLVDRTKWMRRFKGANVFPVVRLADVFMNTRFGGRQRPHFRIERWIRLGEDGTALPPAEQPAIEHRVEPPSAAEVTEDKITF